MTDTRRFAVLAILAIGALGAAGCGSSNESTESTTMSEAKASFSKDCQEGKPSDKPVCNCIADELQDAGQSAQQIADLAERVNRGEVPAQLTKAAGKCSA